MDFAVLGWKERAYATHYTFWWSKLLTFSMFSRSEASISVLEYQVSRILRATSAEV